MEDQEKIERHLQRRDSFGAEGVEEREEEEEEDDEDDILVYSDSSTHNHGQQSLLLSSTSSQPSSPRQTFKSPRIRAGSFSFNFSTHLLPLANSLETVQHSLPTLSATSAIALVVSSQIGSGIFSSPGILSQNCGSPGASLIVWLLAGILAWTGASSFAELGAAIPVNGGAQAYLNYSFGGWASYLFIWTNLVALKPGSAAIISIVGSEYLCRILYQLSRGAEARTTQYCIQGVTE